MFFLGLNAQLIPWIDEAEKFTQNILEKPKDFSHAQEIEKKCATFAKVLYINEDTKIK